MKLLKVAASGGNARLEVMYNESDSVKGSSVSAVVCRQ